MDVSLERFQLISIPSCRMLEMKLSHGVVFVVSLESSYSLCSCYGHA